MKDNKLIEVCDNCKRASCWYGEFMCNNSKYAGTELKTIAELKKIKLEHSQYWSNEKLLEMYGETNPHGYEDKEILKYKEQNGSN